jgi:DNA helicase-2/ATP-dependent DNA helicase PcrA
LTRNRFAFLAVDEVQDLNPIQFRLVELLAGRLELPYNLTLVGDLDQCIYRFGGAKPEYLESFAERISAQRLSLATNHRSMPELLAAIAGLADPEQPLRGVGRVYRIPPRKKQGTSDNEALLDALGPQSAEA